jgi:hypothetical protein
MSIKKKELAAGVVADALGYTGARKESFVQGWVNDPKHLYGRNALNKKHLRKMRRKM